MYGRGGGGKVRDRDRTASRTNEQTRIGDEEGATVGQSCESIYGTVIFNYRFSGELVRRSRSSVPDHQIMRCYRFRRTMLRQKYETSYQWFFFFFSVHGFSVQLRSKFFLSVINFLRKQLFSTVWYTFPFIKQNISLLFLTKSRVESTPFQHRFIFSPTISRYPSAI